MSRFFAGSESESESSSDEDGFQQRPAIATKTFQWSDDEDDTKRTVRTLKDKRFEELQTIIKNMKNHMKIKDMSKVLTDFEDLGKAYDKTKKVVDKEGIPRFYIRTLSDLDDFISEVWEDREGRKNMSKNNAKGLTTLRQRLRKYNRDFEEEIKKYKENPDAGDEIEVSEDENEDNDDDDDEDDVPHKVEDIPEPSDSDSDSMDWGSSSDSDSSSDEDESKYEGNLAAMFLKRPEKEPKEDKDGFLKKEKEEKKPKEKKHRKAKEVVDEGEWTEVTGGAVIDREKPKMFTKDTEVNTEAVIKKLHEIEGARGKKGTDRNEQIDLLIELRKIAQLNNLGTPLDVMVGFHVLGAMYDYNPNIATCMRSSMWNKVLEMLQELLVILTDNADIIVGENVADDSEHVDSVEGQPPFKIRSCILTMVERMDEEFTKILQACDAHSTEYVERLRDERIVCKIIEDTQKYLELREASSKELCRAYIKRIEHTYYKFDPTSKLDDKDPKKEKSQQLMDQLCKYIYAKDVTDRIRTRAILYHVYHHALHDRWFEARDIMLMSHLQDTIVHSDIPTQIIYNRALVQLGLCAFRAGMIRDAHNCLVDIQSLGRAKEMLAQGLLLQRQQERTPEQEKIEKRRQMPYHMHVNLELLECTYLVSALLQEIPYLAAHEFDARRRLISKNFHHVLRVSDRQPLLGPPESMREHIVAASKSMRKGDWRATTDFIINEKMNAKVWSLFQDPDSVRAMIRQKIQEESLRTYLFTYSSIYDSISIESLAEMFELDLSVAVSTVSKMIINEELMASLDEPTQSIVMHRTEPTRLQSLALQLSDKVASLVDNNERIMEMKSGNFFFKSNFGNDNRGREHRDSYNKNDQFKKQGNYNKPGGGGGGGDRYGNRGGYNNRGGYKGDDRKCYKCGQSGHMQRDCPNNPGY